MSTLLFADDAVLLGQNEEQLQKLVSKFDTACKRRNLKINAGRSKVTVSEKNSVTHWNLKSGQATGRPDVFKYRGSKLSRDSNLESKVGKEIERGQGNCWNSESKNQQQKCKDEGKADPG